MDQQGIEGCLLFPTLGVGIEHPLRHDADLTHATLHAFNQWLDEDWGFAWRERIFAAPMLSLMDVEQGGGGARVGARARRARGAACAPRRCPARGAARSATACFDPFWARVNEAGITVAFHAGESGYGEYASHWGEPEDLEAFGGGPFRSVTQTDRSIYDAMAALIVPRRVPRASRTCACAASRTARTGCTDLLRKLKKAERMNVRAFASRRSRRSAGTSAVAPYYEEDVRALADAIGVENVLLGSDFPHAEGLADPLCVPRRAGGLHARRGPPA